MDAALASANIGRVDEARSHPLLHRLHDGLVFLLHPIQRAACAAALLRDFIPD